MPARMMVGKTDDGYMIQYAHENVMAYATLEEHDWSGAEDPYITVFTQLGMLMLDDVKAIVTTLLDLYNKDKEDDDKLSGVPFTVQGRMLL